MNTSVERLQKTMEERTSSINNRMMEFEKDLSLPSTATYTIKSLVADFYAFKYLVWKTLDLLKS